MAKDKKEIPNVTFEQAIKMAATTPLSKLKESIRKDKVSSPKK